MEDDKAPSKEKRKRFKVYRALKNNDKLVEVKEGKLSYNILINVRKNMSEAAKNKFSE